MLVRTENPADLLEIDRMLRWVFPTETEARLVYELRESGFITLGLVATEEEDGTVVAYAAFSPVTLAQENKLWLGLAPVTVASGWRDQEISDQLIREGQNILYEFGYQAIFTLGSSAYYQRFGFEPAANYGLYCRWPESESTFQVCWLEPETSEGIQGEVVYAPPFENIPYPI